MKIGVTVLAVSMLLVVAAFAQDDADAAKGAAPHTDQTNLIRMLNQKLSEARAARDAEDWNKLIAILEDASTLDPSRDLLWFKLGDAYRGAGRYAEAVTAYKKAIAIKSIGPYYNNLGEAEHKLGNDRAAVEAYRGAADSDPQNAFQYDFNIGAVETNGGDFDAANAAFAEAIRANPSYAPPYYFKGLNVLSDSQTLHGNAVIPPEASQVLQKYLELAPDGQYAALCRQTLEFVSRNIVTTFSQASLPDRLAMDQHKQENRTDVPQSAADMFILRKVPPLYPPLARNARIQGPVIFDAIIGENGDVLSLNVLAAIRSWSSPRLTPSSNGNTNPSRFSASRQTYKHRSGSTSSWATRSRALFLFDCRTYCSFCKTAWTGTALLR